MKNNLFSQLTSTENPQGVIAVAKISDKRNELNGEFYLLCDKLQDPGNLGTIIRTAHAAGVTGIILTKGTVDIYNDKTIRSTMGSIFYTPIIHDNDLTFTKGLIGDGYSLVTTSLEESRNFFDEDLSGKIILAVGNEGNGISDEIFDLATKKVKIPMPGGAESLNVPIPLILMVEPSDPGCPDPCITDTPGSTPARADETLVTGLDCASSSKFTLATDPVRFTFF